MYARCRTGRIKQQLGISRRSSKRWAGAYRVDSALDNRRRISGWAAGENQMDLGAASDTGSAFCGRSSQILCSKAAPANAVLE
jgi:hypothetical protein